MRTHAADTVDSRFFAVRWSLLVVRAALRVLWCGCRERERRGDFYEGTEWFCGGEERR